eukprot:COSAG06_NODE_2762_length_6327_cov_5.664740_4_plen_92_part_00
MVPEADSWMWNDKIARSLPVLSSFFCLSLSAFVRPCGHPPGATHFDKLQLNATHVRMCIETLTSHCTFTTLVGDTWRRSRRTGAWPPHTDR